MKTLTTFSKTRTTILSFCKSIFNIAFQIFCVVLLLLNCSGKNNNKSSEIKSQGYTVCFSENLTNEKWGNYLFDHLSERTKNTDILLRKKNNKRFKSIYVEVNDLFPEDYYIRHTKSNLRLQAKNEGTMIWLIYQFMKHLSDCDDRFDANDLPPSVITYESHCGNFDFEYREPHFSSNFNEKYARIIGTNVLERDWGIRESELDKILTEKNSDAVFAKQGEFVNKEQFCFSNEETFQLIKNYIQNNHETVGKNSQYFMITPNDNDIVCDCSLCTSRGNTNHNASPAVSSLIKRLAREFPNHYFFTLAYRTTKVPAKTKLPQNAGVIIRTTNTPEDIVYSGHDFDQLLINWKNVASKIYVWDYVVNPDDYLTPLPILYGLKERLTYYKSNGITGVLLHGGDSNYSPFDDVKTFVSAALMADISLSVDSLCRLFFAQKYPQSGEILCNYYLALEKRMKNKNIPYNVVHGGIEESLRTFLNEDEFVAFYQTLELLIDRVGGEEKASLEKLFTALSFTRLQLAYAKKDGKYGFMENDDDSFVFNTEIQEHINNLAGYKKYKDLSDYRETNGSLEHYLKNWTAIQNMLPVSKYVDERVAAANVNKSK